MIIINRIFVVLNYIAAACLLAAYLAPYVSPANFWYIAFFGLSYPILVLVNLLFVIYWGIQLKWRALISLVIILAGWMTLRSFVQVSFAGSAPAYTSATRLKVMSYNTRLFDLYNWSGDKGTRDKMLELIGGEAPDILCLQEFYNSETGKNRNLDTLLKIQKAKFYDVEYTITVRSTDHWGIATFSAWPIVNSGKILFNTKNNNACIFSDLKINDDTVRVYNVHLQSVRFSSSDYQFLKDIAQDTETEELEHSKNILRRLKRGFVKRSEQATLVAEHMRQCPYPIIVCGDFNDTPASYVYHTLSGGLNDAFVESGSGLGRTYAGPFPSFRIDYILYSPKMKCYEFNTIQQKLSDHYPVTTLLDMPKKP